eukprot:TRINITY_DN2038_c0_g1_i1.p1 TRINITY_DN2038_c0_g1~~TRINITY_DN2038_c0_g1_i1.p1  ORF type:complete len:863 (+),score=94.00 TRINITY_DN2038_c0_g1_i1:3341-5929(+)
MMKKICGLLGHDISIYSFDYNESCDDINRLDVSKYAKLVSCYNVRDDIDSPSIHRGDVIELLILPDASNIWNPSTYKKHATPQPLTCSCHIAYIPSVMSLIRKISDNPKLQYCLECKKYFSAANYYENHLMIDPLDKKKKCPYTFKVITYSKDYNKPKIASMQPSYIISAIDFEAYLETLKGSDLTKDGNTAGVCHYHNDLMNRIDSFWVDGEDVHIMSDIDYEPFRKEVENFVTDLLTTEDRFFIAKKDKVYSKDKDVRADEVKEDTDEFTKMIDAEKSRYGWGNDDDMRSDLLIKYLDNMMCKTHTRINYGYDDHSSASAAIMTLDKISKIYKMLFSRSLISKKYDMKKANEYRASHPGATMCEACGMLTLPADRIIHHNHVTGKIVFYSCCKSCNRKLIPKDFNVLCHNSSKYDNHFILKAISGDVLIKDAVRNLSAVSKSMGRHMKLSINDFAILDTMFYETSSLDSIGQTSFTSCSKYIIDWEKKNPLSDKLHNLVIGTSPFLIMHALGSEEEDERLREVVMRAMNKYIPKLYKTQRLNFENLGGKPKDLWRFLHLVCKKLPFPYEYVECEMDLDDPIEMVIKCKDGVIQYEDSNPRLKDEIDAIIKKIGEIKNITPEERYKYTESEIVTDGEFETLCAQLEAKRKEYRETRGVFSIFGSKLSPIFRPDSKVELHMKKIKDFKEGMENIKELCEIGNIRTLRQYYETYLLNDTSQLLDWASVFGSKIHEVTGIYPFAGICSTAGTAYYAGLLSAIKNGIKFDSYDCNDDKKKNINNADEIHDMFNRGLYGGIASVTVKRLNAKLGTSIIIPMDANSLYPSIMQLWIPIGNFKLVRPPADSDPKKSPNINILRLRVMP